jgi:hypothetical protein
MKRFWLVALMGAFAAVVSGHTALAAKPERVQITGEVMDTWCYVSQVMGGSDSTLGTSHHTCALWCASGGIPVGVITDDGTIYMVLKFEGDATSNANPAVLDIQSHRVTVDGLLYERDGIKYLVVEEVLADEGIVNASHEDYGVVPPFASPQE